MQTYSKDNWQKIPRKVMAAVYSVLSDASIRYGLPVEDLDYRVVMTTNGPRINIRPTGEKTLGQLWKERNDKRSKTKA